MLPFRLVFFFGPPRVPALKRRPSFRTKGMRTRRSGPLRERAWPCLGRDGVSSRSARALRRYTRGGPFIRQTKQVAKVVRCVLCVRAAILIGDEIHWNHGWQLLPEGGG